MTVRELKNILENYSDDTEISALDENGNSCDIDEIVIYNPALSSEPIEKNHLVLVLLER